ILRTTLDCHKSRVGQMRATPHMAMAAGQKRDNPAIDSGMANMGTHHDSGRTGAIRQAVPDSIEGRQ
ncbi:MAG: hypothetical protein PVI08_11235, partial [Gammaproteobacteria bacterium]